MKTLPKRLLCALLAGLCALSGCVRLSLPDPMPRKVYASFYPVYALADLVMRGVPGMEVHCLVQPQNGCVRSYSLSDWDAALLQDADYLILGGCGLESFEDALLSGSVPCVVLMDEAHLLQGEETEASESHFVGSLPYLFLEPQGASLLCAVLAAAMEQLEPEYAEYYHENLSAAQERFARMQSEADASLAGCVLPGAILLFEGAIYAARSVGISHTVSLVREPGADMGDNELDMLLSEMEKTGLRLVLLEKQAPQALQEALTQAGYTLCLLDIGTAHGEQDGSEVFLGALEENLRSLSEAILSLQE